VETFLTAKEDVWAKVRSAATEIKLPTSSGFFSSVVSKVSSLPQIANQLITEVEEVDNWYPTQDIYLAELSKSFFAIQKATNSNTKVKAEKIESAVILAERIKMIGDFEAEYKQKKIIVYYSKFNEIKLQIASLDDVVVKNETTMFEDAITDQQRLSVGSRRILGNRNKALLEYQILQAQTRSKTDSASAEKVAEKKEAEDKEEEAKKKIRKH